MKKLSLAARVKKLKKLKKLSPAARAEKLKSILLSVSVFVIRLVGYILLTGYILYKYQQDNINKTFDFNFSARSTGDNFFNFFNFFNF